MLPVMKTPQTRLPRNPGSSPALRWGVFGLGCAAPGLAWAYMGPGAGLAAIGSLLVVAAAFLLMRVGFVWYPLQRLLRALRNRRQARAATAEGDGVKPGDAQEAGTED